MTVGAVTGVAGGRLLLLFMRKVPLPNEGLYLLRAMAGALAVYGVASVARGSGFLAVFAAGIVLGDERAPYKREIARFHSALASLAELTAFVLLGLTIDLASVGRHWAWPTSCWPPCSPSPSGRCWSACCWHRCGYGGVNACSRCGRP